MRTLSEVSWITPEPRLALPADYQRLGEEGILKQGIEAVISIV
jgi:hypothetical protein